MAEKDNTSECVFEMASSVRGYHVFHTSWTAVQSTNLLSRVYSMAWLLVLMITKMIYLLLSMMIHLIMLAAWPLKLGMQKNLQLMYHHQ